MEDVAIALTVFANTGTDRAESCSGERNGNVVGMAWCDSCLVSCRVDDRTQNRMMNE
jgi:hypothetical protein